MYNPITLTGKKYIVTGASSGIGKATSLLLSKLGATLILIDLNETGLLETAKICENRTKILPVDLMDTKDLKAKIVSAISEIGKVNGFVHLAGRPYLSPLKSLNENVLLDVLKLNSIAGLELAKICSQKSVFSGESGAFVFISSVYGCVGSAANVGYAMSKSALHGVTKSLAIELAPKGIRVNCIAPGFVKTNMLDSISGSFNSEYDELINKLHPLGLGEAGDVANAIAFLVSDMGKWITGSILNVDGGLQHSNSMEKKQFVLVTGATSGIGKEIAIQLSNNYNVVLHGRNLEKLNDAVALCNPANTILKWFHNLEDIDGVENSLVSFISTNSIEIFKFVHCAGVMKMVPLKMSTLSVLQQTFNVNVFVPNFICKVLTNKKANNSALNSTVFISSNISNHGAKAMSTYGSSKSALDGLMRCLAIELAPKVRVNSVLPGAVETEMTKDIFANAEVRERMLAVYPLGIGTPNDICKAVSFLLSENARWITGQQFTVDGGRTINISG